MLNNDIVKGMNILPGSKEPSSVCKSCIEGKHMQTPIPKETSTCADTILGCVFSNVWGPAPTATPLKEQYFILFINDKTCYITVSLIKKKSDTFTKYKAFVAHANVGNGPISLDYIIHVVYRLEIPRPQLSSSCPNRLWAFFCSEIYSEINSQLN
jgi:hypothetical protein